MGEDRPPAAGHGARGDAERTEVAVLGAGVAGLTAAHDLAGRGHAVTVVDRDARCGGTHRSHDVGPYTFDVGSMFFEPNHPLLRMFPGLQDLCPAVVRRQARIAPDGRVRHYPFDPREVLEWPPRDRLRAMADLLRERAAGGEAQDAEAFCLARMGRTTYERSGLAAYIERFHHEPPSRIDAAFCERRMGFVLRRTRWPALAAAGWRAMLRRPVRRGPPRPLLVRPREGFDAFYNVVRRDLEARGVRFALGAPITRLRSRSEVMTIETAGGLIEADRVVGAMPLDALHRAAVGRGTGLEGIDLLTLFVSAGQVPGTKANVIFNFHPKGRWKRITVYSRIYGPASGREYFAVEITLREGQPPDPEAAFDDLRGHVTPLGLFSDDLRLEGFDVVKDAYPLYRKGCDALVREATAQLASLGIAPVGRQGRFEYLPTSMQVVARTRDHLAEAGLGADAARDGAAHG